VRGDLLRPPEVEAAREALFQAREQRVRPGLDDKVLTEWNALMIATLAEAGAAADEPAWVEAAVRSADFLLTALRDAESTWMRSWQAGDGDRPAAARHHAYAVDHAALVDAFTRLAEATGEARWIAEARTVADTLLDRFWDPDRGGLFTTGDGSDAPVVRQKDFLDNATPAANSLAAAALLRLAALTGEDRYRDRAEQILALFGPLAANAPSAFAHLLGALDLHHGGITEVVVVGGRSDLVRAVQRRFLPSAVLAWGEPYDSPLWEGRDEGLAYVCQNYACLLPASTVEALAGQLES
jgi:hypothetical protein